MTYRDTPPAFQEYATDMLASRSFRSMSLAERGLCWTMRLECWIGGSIPATPTLLAKVLGFPSDEVKAALTPAVRGFFAESNGELTSPDLDAYRATQQERKSRMSEGGRNGGKKTQAKRLEQATYETTPEATLKAPERRGEERSGAERKGKASIGRRDFIAPFSDDDLDSDPDSPERWRADYSMSADRFPLEKGR